jgi:hypothetical protein
VETGEIVWQGKIGSTPLTVGVPHAGRIIAEWDTPDGSRHKIADSIEQFERAVLFQLLLEAGSADDPATKDVIAAIEKAESERPRRGAEPGTQRRRKNPKVRQHRRSRRPPRRR